MQTIDTIVIGAGQAGLAASHELMQLGVDHIVLEKDKVGAGWANRWESFCLVTPNWSVQLPGFPYDGTDPEPTFAAFGTDVCSSDPASKHCGQRLCSTCCGHPS